MRSPPASRLDFIELIKGTALTWILLNHIAETLWGHPWFGNPSGGWPTLDMRLAQLIPMNGPGISGLAANLLRYVGWMGDQAVGWFILLSGFALSYSQLVRSGSGKTETLADFYARRCRRVVPMWWTVHILMLLPIALLGWKVTIADSRFFLSLVGFRVTPDQLYFGVPSWWFIGLLMQLYFAFPFLHKLFERAKPAFVASTLIFVSLAVRWWGMESFPEWTDAWNRGSIFVSRMAEFATGMWLAFAFYRSPDAVSDRLRSGRGILLSALLFVIGNVASISRWGIVPAPWLMAIGGVGLAFAFFHSETWAAIRKFLGPSVGWIGRHSLSLFLVHHPVFWMMLRHETVDQLSGRILIRCAIGLVITIVVSLVIEWFSGRLERIIEWGVHKWSTPGLLMRFAAVVVAAVLLVLPFELWIRKHMPQDITDFGWSERPSLIADDELGFRLKPSSRTQLRWESYDYAVTANAAGFPGPELPLEKQNGAFRVMTLGDAFTSAEGVDTNNAWPRLLENKLRSLPGNDRKIDVVNFGITGFGPNQYASIARKHVPLLKPDLIVIGFFTNDYVDVQTSADEFQAMIGFDKPASDTWLALLTGRHVARFLRGNVAEAVAERFTGEPCSHTRFFCQSDLFDRNNTEYVLAGRELVKERFADIARLAAEHNAKICVMSIPAPIQAVPVDQLHYVRPCLNLLDEDRYDYDYPQRLTGELADAFGFEHVDLRNALGAATDQQPYQPKNLHFTETGHEVVSDALMPVVKEYLLRLDSTLTRNQ